MKKYNVKVSYERTIRLDIQPSPKKALQVAQEELPEEATNLDVEVEKE